jgi:hypothetical protein
MPFVPFYELCPETAKEETRSVTVMSDAKWGLPAGDYGFVEMFCDEKGCDCRRVMFYVIAAPRGDLRAVIAYGWESREFYAKWMRDSDPDDLDNLQGPCLNFGSPASVHAPALLEMTKEVLLNDAMYVERVKRHYRMFRAKIDEAENAAAELRRLRRKRRRRKK